MPRALPAGALAAMMAPETSEAFITLLSITMADNTVQRFTDNSVNITSSISGSSEVYSQLPFTVVLAANEEGKVSDARLTLDNVDRRLIDEIRSQEAPLLAQIDIVSSRDLNERVASFQDTVLRNVSYNSLTITASLATENLMAENFSQLITGRYYPAVFAAR